MSTGYTNTRLVDCNRLNSAEHRQNLDDKSRWSSKVGSGIHLQPGDKVSIHSSFISELGCGNADVIETNGDLLDTKNFNYTNFVTPGGEEYPNYDVINNENYLPNNIKSRTASNIDAPVKIYDNGLNIVISYYKNSNGEQHIHLPRRFDKFPYTKAGDNGLNEWFRANEYRNEDSYDNGNVYNIPDYQNRVWSDWHYYREPNYGIKAQKEGEPANRPAPAFIEGTGTEASIYHSVPGAKDASSINGTSRGKEFIRSTDNSRYTIYVMKNSYWDETATDIEDFPSDVNNPALATGERDIAMVEYIKYKELKSYKINDGFNSPANIGTQLTAELNNVKKTTTKTYYNGEIPVTDTRYEVNPPTYPNLPVKCGGPGPYLPEISMSIESDTYKLIDAANWFTLSSNNYKEYYDTAGDSNLRDSVWYYSGYSMIGIKRPELFESIRKINPPNFPDFSPYDKEDWFTIYGTQVYNIGGTLDPIEVQIDKVIDPANPNRYLYNKDSIILTDIEWSTNNLNMIKDIFDAEQKYKELFDYKPNNRVNVNDARFIHMDVISDTEISLGYDGYENYDNGTTQTIGMPSSVIFVYYQKENDGIMTDGAENDLAYGFGYKYYNPVQAKDCIGFSLKNIQLTNTSIFIDGAPTNFISGQRKCGFDWHFNAYGTASLLPYTGITETDCDNRTFNTLYKPAEPFYRADVDDATYKFPDNYQVDIGMVGSNILGAGINMIDFSWALRHIYCGAIDPLIKFDTDTSRFQISQLHTSELYGNQFMTGAAAGVVSGWQGLLKPTTDTGSIASSNVYKINKHVEPFLYTPDIAPYFTECDFPSSKNGVQWNASANGTYKNNEGYFGYPTDGGGFNYAASSNENVKVPAGANFRYKNEGNLFTMANTKIKLWSIFDAESGISIEDFGVDSDWSHDSLLGILGFEFIQLDNTKKTGNYQTRLTKDTMNIITPVTTNALITPLDTKLLNKNIWGGGLPNNPSIPYTTMTNIYGEDRKYSISDAESPPGATPVTEYGVMNFNTPRGMINNEIIITQESATFTANKLPRKMTIPYYLICSSLIDDKFYNGNIDGTTAPIMGVVNRENGFGDYYFGGASTNQFTITAPTTITEITTQILDPKMKPARVDEDSCIIYSIERQMNNNLNILSTLPKKEVESILNPPGL